MVLKIQALLDKFKYIPNKPCPGPEQLSLYIPGLASASHTTTTLKDQLVRPAEMMFARNFGKQIRQGYKFLCEEYQAGDMIYLFGFSRGAYQVRTLAAMIREVGFIHKMDDGKMDDGKIKDAWNFYKKTDVNDARIEERSEQFKSEHSREPMDVPIRFVGTWDTVSSIGYTGVETMPFASFSSNVETYRHALALDEYRGRFTPEYVDERSSRQPFQDMRNGPCPRIKEVWFAGGHSNVGGEHSYGPGQEMTVSGNWMLKEAADAGLRFQDSDDGYKWRKPPLSDVQVTPPNFYWNIFEIFPGPIRDQRHGQKSLRPHLWKPRLLLPTQKIHISAYVLYLVKEIAIPKLLVGEVLQPAWPPHSIFDMTYDVDLRYLDVVWFKGDHVQEMFSTLNFDLGSQAAKFELALGALKVLKVASITHNEFVIPSEPLRQRLDGFVRAERNHHSQETLRLVAVAVAVLVRLHRDSLDPPSADFETIDKTLKHLIQFGDLEIQSASMEVLKFILGRPSLRQHIDTRSMLEAIEGRVQKRKRMFGLIPMKKPIALALNLRSQVLDDLRAVVERDHAVVE